MTKTASGTTTIEAQYAYDPYGIATKLQGSQDADFQYASYYMHAPSGLNLTVFRAYSSSFGRFINRDPIGERGGVNLYAYVDNDPISLTDRLGFDAGYGWMHNPNASQWNPGPISAQDFWNAVDLILWLDFPEIQAPRQAARTALRGMGKMENMSVCHMAPKKAKQGPPDLTLLGARGTQVASYTLWLKGSIRVDVSNPKPGYRPGQIHMQDGPQGAPHWIIDPDTRQFVDPKVPTYLKNMLQDPAVQNAITKGRSYLGLP